MLGKYRIALMLAIVASGSTDLCGQKMLHEFTGDTFSDYFGTAVSGAGDVNNDGFEDVVVGAYHDDNLGVSSGSARVFSGKNGLILYTFNGDSQTDWLGYSVSGAGDVNNDGFDDVIAGAPGDDPTSSTSGSAKVFSGKDGSLLHKFSAVSGDEFGVSVSGAGDVDNDGYDDVIVGDPCANTTFGQAGGAWVYSGKNGALLFSVAGDWFNDGLGEAVSGAGDVNADGHDDVIVSAPNAHGAGVYRGLARVYSGKDGATLYTFYGDSDNDRLGEALCDAGDVNGDGYADVVVGAIHDDTAAQNAGIARVYSGKDGSTLYTFAGAMNDFLGRSVGGGGDLDGDGFDDVIASSVNANENAGEVRAYSGRDGSLLFVVDSFGFESLGGSVAITGDVDGDGRADLIAGSIGSGGHGRVYSGDSVAQDMPTFGVGCVVPGSVYPVPTLAMSGFPQPGGCVELKLSSYQFSTPGMVLIGLNEISSNAGCGCSLLVQPLLQLPIVTDPFGFLKTVFPLPGTVPSVTLKLQAFVAENQNPCGYIVTNGVSLVIQ